MPDQDTMPQASAAPFPKGEPPELGELHAHKANEVNNELRIIVADAPGPGGACHAYHMLTKDGAMSFPIHFQKGPIKEAGVNGITIEALLAICKHRLEGFQSGDFACESNEAALEAINVALDELHSRTRERQARGVEGTNQQ